ncbi:hypothetical protein [Hymenobacter chitinivorans]|uniref:Uncharacterized protein n=1 Tax=Hymenobacter chitinivorans DSM 11115 TaxID=1121954 RepID=A0A2M9BPS6_9BACT|nr:hypothetical protein [Hymenobacter chitinivorans]PJJ59956.1 hypothetical protein CLV45_1378 [Hymenobacter chitinivorans DSM 11115]
MKTYVLVRLSLLMLALGVALAGAAAPLPTGGYWNVETNLTTRDYTIIRFFNDQNQLIYEERIDNLCLGLSKDSGPCRATTRQLNLALQQVLRDPATARQTTTMLALQLGQNRRVQRVYAVR